ncbi:MAG: TlpA family protein disulfide reductase [Acidimicrobiales bacterium]
MGHEVAYAAALALAAVFALAGAAKLRRRATTERTFRSLGLRASPTLALGVPLAELVLAVGLVAVPAWAGLAALAVLAGFTTFVLLAIRRRAAVGCGCFGSSRVAPVGGAEVVRNGFLVLAALAAAFADGPVVPGPLALVVVALAGGAAAAVVTTVARRATRSPYLGHQGLASGLPAPYLPDLDYERGDVTLVAFVAPTCAGCDELRSSLRHVEGLGAQLRVINLDDSSTTTFAAFGVRSTPYLVAIDRHGRIRGGTTARTRDDIDHLLRR